MNRPIRKVGAAVAVLFVALFINLNVVQVLQGSQYRDNSANQRVHLNEYSSPRGTIQVQGTNIAVSVATKDELKYLRTYPQGELYAGVTGYYPFDTSPTLIEASENTILSGDSNDFFLSRLRDTLSGRAPAGGSVQLTLNADAQKAAYAAMKGANGQYRPGAVVAVDPQTGAILASVSTPSYDPNVLSSHNLDMAAHALGCYQALTDPPQGDDQSDAAYATQLAASINAQLELRRGGSTKFLADYLANPSTFPLGDLQYSPGATATAPQTASWTPYISLNNLLGVKSVTAAQKAQVTAAYRAQFSANKEQFDPDDGQFANGVTGCSDVPLDPTATFAADNSAPSPLQNKGFFERYFAGSIFKIIDSAAALQTATGSGGNYVPASVIPAPDGYHPYDPTDTSRCPAALNTDCVENFDGENCGTGQVALQTAFALSCNTAFAQLAVEKLGAAALISEAAKFGFGSAALLHQLPGPVTASTIGDPQQLRTDKGALAQTAFGQRDVQVTPMQAAMMAAAVANNGTMMTPYLVKAELNPNLSVLHAAVPTQYGQVIPANLAGDLQQMMEAVVSSGTGTSAAITQFAQQVVVGGKTGTADTGATSASNVQPDAWFTGFAMVQGTPRIAVAVLLEHAGVNGNEVTGGEAAGPVAKAVITAYLKSIGVR